MSEARTTHPTSQQLANYGLGKLPPGELSSIHAHVAACDECRLKVENLPPDSFIAQLRGGAARGASMLPPVPPSPSNTSLPIRRAAEAGPDAVPAELLESSKFKILGKLGQGGMGSVYKVQRSFLDDVVALKVMNAAVVENPEARKRFLREMKAAGQLQHPNIVRALDAEQMGDLLVLVMEFVPGIALDRLVKQRGPLPVDFACDCIVQAAMGLQHAHEKGMVHRDIKPANLMVTAKEKDVKLLDFGLVQGPSVQTGTRQTRLETFMGTPEYVAPEQAGDARNADIRADVYSLGCTLYFLLAGQPPFKRDTIVNTIMAHVEDEAQPLTEVRKDMPAGLWLVVAKMMAKKPVDRYQTPIEVAQALKPFVVAGKARRPDSMPAGRSAAIDLGAPTVLPPWIPPVPTPQKAKESSVGLPAAKGSPATRPRPRREKAKEKGPAWMVGAAVAAGLLVAALGAMVVATQFNASRQRQAEARRLQEEAEGVAAEEAQQKEEESQKQSATETMRRRQEEAEAQQKEERRKHAEAEAVRLREEQARAAAASLRVEPEAIATLWCGKRTMLKVRLQRQGYAGEIRLRIDGLPAQVKVANPVILLAAQETAEIELVAAAEGPETESQVTVSAKLDDSQAKHTLRLRVLKEWDKEITNSIGMKLVRIEPGKFQMGSPTGETGPYSSEQQHEVEITKAFYMGVYAVTQAEYKEVMGETPSFFSASGGGKDRVKGLDTSKFPVEKVNWHDAVKFCEKLSGLAKEKDAGRVYRLPTEAEWEYACRAGTKTKYHSGDEEGDLKKAGWYTGNSDLRPHPVGKKKPNAWGLYDMHGNVFQWCSDCYDYYHYRNTDKKDPKGPFSGVRRVLRGGSWYVSAGDCRAAFRNYDAPGDRDDYTGFRVVCAAPRTR